MVCAARPVSRRAIRAATVACPVPCCVAGAPHLTCAPLTASSIDAEARARDSHEGRHVNDLFHKFSATTSALVGTPWAFILATATIVVWAITGPVFHFSDTWQLVINTGTTIVTFLMVFLIQNTQNRDATALHLKLDELIRAQKTARNSLVDLEELSDEELARLRDEFKRVHEGAHRAVSGEASETTARKQ